MKNLTTTICALFFLLPIAASAQNGLLEKHQNKNGETYFVSFLSEESPSFSKYREVLTEFFGIQQKDSLRLLEKNTTANGITHYGYSQYLNGFPVALSYLAVHVKNDKILSINGDWAKISEINTKATLNEKVALVRATDNINAESYKWQVPTEEDHLKVEKNDKTATYLPKGELVIVKDYLQSNSVYRLAYKFDVYAHKPLGRFDVYVDAINGNILHKNSRIKNTNSTGTADTRYSGNQGLITDSFTGGFRLRETRGASSVAIETFNMRSAGGSYGASVDFVDGDNNWTAAEYNNTNRDNAGLDVQWGTELVHDYWRNVRGRNSWNNAGGSLLSYVNADLPAINSLYTNSDNAFWDGSRMTYGQGTSAQPYASVDIIAHEIGHGVCDNAVAGTGMIYSGESGAIEEGLSDIWGAVIENTSTTGKQTWILAEDVVFGGIRSMDFPLNSGQPDSYLGTSWHTLPDDDYGVHTNSGVMNRWFFLLSQGGTGFNNGSSSSASSGTPWTVNGIGIADAATVVFSAEDNYFTAGTTYTNARSYTIQAARDEFGTNSCQEIAVTNAWNAVGVGAAFSYPGSVAISGSDLVCTSGSYSVSNQPAGTTVSWTTDKPWILSIDANTGLASVTGNGPVTIIATINTGCSSVSITRSIHAGTATTLSITSDATGCTGYSATIITTASGSPSYYNWYISSANAANGYVTDYGNGSASFNSYIPDCYGLTLNMTNACGSSSDGTSICVSNCFSAYQVYPNPAKDYVSVKFEHFENTESMPEQITLYSEKTQQAVYSLGNSQIFTSTSKEGILQIPVSTLPRGTYYLHLTSGKNSDQKIDKIRILLE